MLPEQPNPTDEPGLDFPSPPPPPPREPFWSYSDLFLFLGLALTAAVAISVIGAVFVHAFSQLESDSGILLLSLQLALYGLFYACFWAVFRTRYDRPVFRSLGWRQSAFPLAFAIVIGPALAFFVSIVAAKLNTPNIKTPFDKMVNSELTFSLLAITAIIAAPIFEELFFRGFLQPLLCRTFGIVAGVLITAALFGAAHGAEYKWTWQYILAVGVVGAVFGWVRARTNSVVPSTIMHGCYNAVFVGALYFAKHGKFS